MQSNTTTTKDTRLNEIIRVKKRPNGFVMIDKGFLDDPNLSWKAKGILTYLLSKPDNWRAVVGDIVKHATDGKAAVYSGLNELKKHGYYEKVAIRSEDGRRIKRWESTVYEVPIQVIPASLHSDIREVETQEKTESIQPETVNQENEPLSLLPNFQEIDNQEIDNQDIENRERNNNDYNNNDFNNNHVSQVKSSVNDRRDEDRPDPAHKYTMLIKENIGYDRFLRPEDIALIDELVSIMVETITKRDEYIRMKDGDVRRELVKAQLLKLTDNHITFVIDNFRRATADSPVRKRKQYLLVMLYNASMEYESEFAQYG